MGLFQFYALNQEKGYPGMKANTTLDTVDSFAAEGGIDPGEAVIRGTNPDTQVKAVAATADISKVIGIAVHTHKDPNENGKYYEDGRSVSVMTSGDILVEVAGTVTAGGAVAMLIDDTDGPGFYASTEDDTVTIPGMTYQESGDKGDLVTVRIRK